MLIDAKGLGEGEFPDPVAQAEALLEMCRGDIHEAQLLASTNITFARNEGDHHYWSRVKLLIPGRERMD